MSWPKPYPGLVIRYAYLWAREAALGREEGVKDRPCAIILVVRRDADGADIVRVLPITHAPPSDLADAVEIPPATKLRLGLDSERAWIVLTEANDFVWPGPDLRPAINGDPSTAAYGMLPPRLFTHLKQRVIEAHRRHALRGVKRTS